MKQMGRIQRKLTIKPSERGGRDHKTIRHRESKDGEAVDRQRSEPGRRIQREEGTDHQQILISSFYLLCVNLAEQQQKN